MNITQLAVWSVLLIFSAHVKYVNSMINTHNVTDEASAKEFLKLYGYWDTDKLELTEDEEEEIMRNGLIKFQSKYSLTANGILNDETMAAMSKPRCSRPDVKPSHGPAAFGTPYPKRQFSYDITKYSAKMKNSEVDRCFRGAYAVWEKCTDLRFKKTNQGSKADFNIQYARLDHGDGSPFDGPSGTLAHAFSPQYGHLHMDDDENFSNIDVTGNWDGYDCMTVAAHEIGHNMGLDHSSETESLMFPAYTHQRNDEGKAEIKLHKTDITNMLAMYPLPDRSNGPCIPRSEGGTKEEVRSTTMTPDAKCPRFLDAIANGADGNAYLFQGKYVFKISASKIGRYAVSKMFPGLPTPVNAAVYDDERREIVLFVGNMEYRYTINGNIRRLLGGSPREYNVFKKVTSAFNVADYGPVALEGSSFVIMFHPHQLHADIRTYYPKLPLGKLKGSAILPTDHRSYIFTNDAGFHYDMSTSSSSGSAISLKSLLRC